MGNGNLQYVADTIAIEYLASDLPIQKEAGLFEDFGFSGVASSIINQVKGLLVPENTPTGWLKAIANLLISGALFKAHWLLGVVYAFANALGIDIIGIGKQILSKVYDAIKGGDSVVMSDVHYYGKIAMAASNNGYVKRADLFGLFGGGKKSPKVNTVERMFGDLLARGQKRKLSSLIVAIIVWALKTALLGAGLVTGAGLITNFIRGKPDSKETPAEPDKETSSLEPEQQTKPSEPAAPSDEAAELFSPSSTEMKQSGRWMTRIIGNLRETLITWATDIYPELSGYEDIIYSSPAFSRVLDKFEEHYDEGEPYMMVPKEFGSKKQVVDTFAKEVLSKIKGMK